VTRASDRGAARREPAKRVPLRTTPQASTRSGTRSTGAGPGKRSPRRAPEMSRRISDEVRTDGRSNDRGDTRQESFGCVEPQPGTDEGGSGCRREARGLRPGGPVAAHPGEVDDLARSARPPREPRAARRREGRRASSSRTIRTPRNHPPRPSTIGYSARSVALALRPKRPRLCPRRAIQSSDRTVGSGHLRALGHDPGSLVGDLERSWRRLAGKGSGSPPCCLDGPRHLIPRRLGVATGAFRFSRARYRWRSTERTPSTASKERSPSGGLAGGHLSIVARVSSTVVWTRITRGLGALSRAHVTAGRTSR